MVISSARMEIAMKLSAQEEEKYHALAQTLGCGRYGMAGHNSVLKPAYDALSELGPAAISPLIRVLGNPHPNTRRVAAGLLRDLGEEKLYRLIKGDDDDIRRLGICGDPRAVASLLEALSFWNKGCGSHWDVRAAKLLGLSGDPRAIEPLLKIQDEFNGPGPCIFNYRPMCITVEDALKLLTSERLHGRSRNRTWVKWCRFIQRIRIERLLIKENKALEPGDKHGRSTIDPARAKRLLDKAVDLHEELQSRFGLRR